MVSGLLSAGEECPPLAGGAAAITDLGGERHLATLRPAAVEAEVVDVVPQLTHVLVQPLPLLKWVQVIMVLVYYSVNFRENNADIQEWAKRRARSCVNAAGKVWQMW